MPKFPKVNDVQMACWRSDFLFYFVVIEKNFSRWKEKWKLLYHILQNSDLQGKNGKNVSGWQRYFKHTWYWTFRSLHRTFASPSNDGQLHAWTRRLFVNDLDFKLHDNVIRILNDTSSLIIIRLNVISTVFSRALQCILVCLCFGFYFAYFFFFSSLALFQLSTSINFSNIEYELSYSCTTWISINMHVKRLYQAQSARSPLIVLDFFLLFLSRFFISINIFSSFLYFATVFVSLFILLLLFMSENNSDELHESALNLYDWTSVSWYY